MNSYLSIASKVLQEARQPLSARQILRAAYELQLVPQGLYGKTQHKTLHARIAEDILKQRSKSEFIRTDPGRFFLRSFLSDGAIPLRHKKQYIASLRADQLKKFQVLCVERADLESMQHKFGKLVNFTCFSEVPLKYRTLASVAKSVDMFSVRVIVLVYRQDQLLLRRGRSTKDSIQGAISVGLMGFVKRDDKTLFSEDRYGVREAALRTLAEQLYLPPIDLEKFVQHDFISAIAVVVDLNNADIKKEVAAVVACRCPPEFDPTRQKAATETFYWQSQTLKINNLDQYDPWSKYILPSEAIQKALLKGP